MKKSITLCVISLTLILTSCGSAEKKESTSPEQSGAATEKVQYTCSMDPDVITDKPGSCPKCGMDLIVKENVAADTTKSKP